MSETESAVRLELDINELTLLEVKTIVRHTGIPLGELGKILDSGSVDPEVVEALVWVIKHRADPTYTISDAENESFFDAVELVTAAAEKAAADTAPTNRAERRAAGKRGGGRPPA